MVIEIYLFCHVISQDHMIKDYVTLRMKAPPGKSQFCMFNGHRHRGSGYNMLYSHNFKWLLSFWSLWLTVGKSIIKITSLTNFFCQMIQNRKTWWKIYYSLVSNQENENHQTISNKNYINISLIDIFGYFQSKTQSDFWYIQISEGYWKKLTARIGYCELRKRGINKTSG